MNDFYRSPITPTQMAERVYSVTGEDMRSALNLSYEVDLSLARTYCWTARLQGHFRENSSTKAIEEKRQLLGIYNTRLQCWNMDPLLVPVGDVPLFTGFIAGRATAERQKRLNDLFPFIDLQDPQTIEVRKRMEAEVGDLGRKLISDWAVVAGGALASADEQTEFIATLQPKPLSPHSLETVKSQQSDHPVIEQRLCIEALNTCIIENQAHARPARSHQRFIVAREHQGTWEPDKAYLERDVWQRLKFLPDWLTELEEIHNFSAQHAAIIR